MSNSPLVSYTKISPHKNSPRKARIDTITIHCTAGRMTLQSLGEWFSNPNSGASSNYAVDMNGNVGMYVSEGDRSWCSSNGANDHRAVTIEVVTDAKEPYATTSAAIEGLVNLLVDICKRNEIPKLLWLGDKSITDRSRQNVTVHRWFANTACPGTYLYNALPAICQRVNDKLSNSDAGELYRVQIGAYAVRANAEACLAKAKAAGFDDAFITHGCT